MQPTRGLGSAPLPPADRGCALLFGLAPGGVCRVSLRPRGAGIVTVALVLASRRTGVTRHPALGSSDFPQAARLPGRPATIRPPRWPAQCRRHRRHRPPRRPPGGPTVGHSGRTCRFASDLSAAEPCHRTVASPGDAVNSRTGPLGRPPKGDRHGRSRGTCARWADAQRRSLGTCQGAHVRARGRRRPTPADVRSSGSTIRPPNASPAPRHVNPARGPWGRQACRPAGGISRHRTLDPLPCTGLRGGGRTAGARGAGRAGASEGRNHPSSCAPDRRPGWRRAYSTA